MGRTNPTYRDALRAIEERWAEFRRALRRHDQPRFDRLFEYAREHADASGLLNHQNPLLLALLSIDLEQETCLDEHEQRIAELETRSTSCPTATETRRTLVARIMSDFGAVAFDNETTG